jgi:hypothetical protein
LTFVPSSIAFFYPHGKKNGQQTVSGEANHAGVAFLLQFLQEEEVMLTPICIGHTCLTHGHLLCGELAPVCINCAVPLTVLLIVVKFPQYGEVNGTFSDMVGDDQCSSSNMLAFLNALTLNSSTRHSFM